MDWKPMEKVVPGMGLDIQKDKQKEKATLTTLSHTHSAGEHRPHKALKLKLINACW